MLPEFSEERGAVGELLREEEGDEADHGAASVGHLALRLEGPEVLGGLLEAALLVAAEDGGEGGGEGER